MGISQIDPSTRAALTATPHQLSPEQGMGPHGGGVTHYGDTRALLSLESVCGTPGLEGSFSGTGWISSF